MVPEKYQVLPQKLEIHSKVSHERRLKTIVIKVVHVGHIGCHALRILLSRELRYKRRLDLAQWVTGRRK